MDRRGVLRKGLESMRPFIVLHQHATRRMISLQSVNAALRLSVFNLSWQGLMEDKDISHSLVRHFLQLLPATRVTVNVGNRKWAMRKLRTVQLYANNERLKMGVKPWSFTANDINIIAHAHFFRPKFTSG